MKTITLKTGLVLYQYKQNGVTIINTKPLSKKVLSTNKIKYYINKFKLWMK